MLHLLSNKRKEARKREEASNLMGFTYTHAWHDKLIAQERSACMLVCGVLYVYKIKMQYVS